MKEYKLMVIAVIVAIAITTTMDFTGYSIFSALPLLAIIIVFWIIYRLSLKEIGLTFSSLRFYGLALFYPAAVLGLAVFASFAFNQVEIQDVDWSKAGINVLLGSTVGVLMVVLTEEGFFRGWLWGALKKKGFSTDHTLLATTLCFMLWHISAVSSPTDYGLPWHQIPIYLANAILLALIWGLMRQISGSILVSSVSHAVWNAFAYELFAYGEKEGILGISNSIIFGPEVGILGIVFNGTFFLWLWKKYKTMPEQPVL